MKAGDFLLSPHFSYFELTDSKQCPDLVPANREFFSREPYLSRLQRLCTYALEPIRAKVGKPVIVLSGGRTKELNKAVGGSLASQHMALSLNSGAADIRVEGMTPDELAEAIKSTDIFWHQLGIYTLRGFVHYGMPLGGVTDGQILYYPKQDNNVTAKDNLVAMVKDVLKYAGYREYDFVDRMEQIEHRMRFKILSSNLSPRQQRRYFARARGMRANTPSEQTTLEQARFKTNNEYRRRAKRKSMGI